MKKSEKNTLDLPEYDDDKHWTDWIDMVGRHYVPGDIVAYAATVGRSSGLTVGMVKRINKRDSKGELLTIRRWNSTSRDYTEGIPTCTVTITPLVDSANRYGRWTDRDVTIGPDKIIRLDLSIAEVAERGMLNG